MNAVQVQPMWAVSRGFGFFPLPVTSFAPHMKTVKIQSELQYYVWSQLSQQTWIIFSIKFFKKITVKNNLTVHFNEEKRLIYFTVWVAQ